MSTPAAHPPQMHTPAGDRIVVLDVLRAFAILMMLQGHFIDTMLDDRYRDLANPIYAAWSFMRGITAPVFFFVSGAVFVFLVLRESRPWRQSERIRKGLRRAFLLLLLGYVLKWNFLTLLWTLEFYPSYFTVDVFQILGLTLLVAIAVIGFCQRTGLPLPLAFLALALAAFVFAPEIKTREWSALPVFLQNYLVKSHGSTFTLLPWIGYALFGGVAGWWMRARPQILNSAWTPVILLATGLAAQFLIDDVLRGLYQITGLQVVSNYLFRALGFVLIVLSVFIWIVRHAGPMPPLLLKIGRETLVIYSVHYVVLYGTWLGIGIHDLGRGTWPPWAAAMGALMFLACFVYLVYRIEDVRRWWGRARRHAVQALLRIWPRRES